MRETFPDAEVTGYESLIPAMTRKIDTSSRQAVRADAAVIVTLNLREFPHESLEPYELEARHPDEFLLDQLDLYPARTIRCLREQAEDSKVGPLSLVELLSRLTGSQVPRFAAEVRRHL
ncbi:MAG: hypothetical protein M3Z25_14000 [Actinomycetota bacterium]|nr:hypothetical protein [Actinomycetota bacterium]